MGMQVTRVFGDDKGETHLASMEIGTEEFSQQTALARFEIPTTTMTYTEYPLGEIEMIPGFHCAPRRQFVLCLQGGFEVTTTSGDSKLFQPGDWFLADDVGSKGHTTKGVGADQRINLAIGIDDKWQLPGA